MTLNMTFYHLYFSSLGILKLGQSARVHFCDPCWNQYLSNYLQSWIDLSALLVHQKQNLCLFQFHFSAERQKIHGPEYILVTEYHSQGSLLKFLKTNTVTWREMCILGHSLAAGLAYLHNDGKCQTMFNISFLDRGNIEGYRMCLWRLRIIFDQTCYLE